MSEDDSIDIDEEVIEKLTGAADTMAKLLERVMQNHDSQSTDMDYFRRDLGVVRDAIRHIAKVLHEGNGEKPLISRVAILETQIQHMKECFAEIDARDLESQRLEDEQELIRKRGSWRMWVAIVAGVSALGVEVVRLFT